MQCFFFSIFTGLYSYAFQFQDNFATPKRNDVLVNSELPVTTHPLALTQATTNLKFCLQILPFLPFHINGIIKYMVFYIWLLSQQNICNSAMLCASTHSFLLKNFVHYVVYATFYLSQISLFFWLLLINASLTI